MTSREDKQLLSGVIALVCAVVVIVLLALIVAGFTF